MRLMPSRIIEQKTDVEYSFSTMAEVTTALLSWEAFRWLTTKARDNEYVLTNYR